MALSALALTAQGPTHDSGYRVRRGFTNLLWERVFGTNAVATIPTGIACTTVDSLWDQTAGTGAGFWPRFPDGFPTWRAERKVGNAEYQRYRHLGIDLKDGSNISLAQATYGAPHIMGTYYVELTARAHSSLVTDANVAHCYTENTDTGVLHNLNSGQTVVCEIPAGLTGFAVGQRLIIGNRDPNSGGKERGCSATVVSYSGTTLTATSNGAPNNMTTGSYQQLYILQMNFEAGMLITRTNLPPAVEGYWEIEQQLPSGAGHWTADWFIHEGIWPPEVDKHERFETTDSVVNRVHAGFINSAVNRKITLATRLFNSYCTADTLGDLKNMTWGTDLTNSFHNYGLEWGYNFLSHVLDDALMRTEFYRWIALGNSGALPVGAFGFNPRLVMNYALGPPVENYRLLTIGKFPGSYRIKHARFYGRP